MDDTKNTPPDVGRLLNKRFFLTALTAFVHKMQMIFDTNVNVTHTGDKRYFENMIKHLGVAPKKQSAESTGDIELRFAGMNTDSSQNTAPTSINIYMKTEGGEVGKYKVDNARRRTVNIPVECRFLTTDALGTLDRAEAIINELSAPRYFKFEWLGLQCAGAITQDAFPEALPGKQSAIDLPDEDNNDNLPINLMLELQFFAFDINKAEYLADAILKDAELTITADSDSGAKDKVLMHKC